MDTSAWLRSLGLGQYEQAFRDNAIDAEVLPRLTAEDLKEIGVVPVGHRRKLLEAIAAMRGEEPPADDRSAGVRIEPAQGSAGTPIVADAERRQLTVLFCDLVGSTAFAARLDPEDLREVIGAYHRCAAEVVGRFEGHVAKYLGDGVLAYFGYPRAHEDDAERAVRAGLDLVEAVGGLRAQHGCELQARVGIATGLVVVGDLIGEGAARDEVVGDTPNLAARLQALAEPGNVVIASGTRRLTGSLFELDDLGAQRLKGFSEPVPAWRVTGAGRAQSRFEARQAAGLTPLVGREHEIGLLLDRWQLAKDGEGQVVLLAGEPGIGKSRIVQTLIARLEREPHIRLRRACSPFHQNSALYPVISQLERAAAFERDDSPERKLAKLEALLAQSTNVVAETVPLMADLLSIPTAGRYPPLELSPQRRKEKLFEALLAQLEGLAARQPVLYVFEDVQWIDPSSLELLGRVIDRVQRLPVLAAITFRPEFSPPWSGHAHTTLLTLNRLGRRQVASMVERLTVGKALPVEVLDQIIAKTDGVPLFVEELTKTVLESGLLREEAEHYVLGGPLPPLAIPATLQDSLMARLDRLALVKEVAQIGAVLGREFPHELLAAVTSLDGNELENALNRLVEAELILRRGTPPPQATYVFKHALVRDAAYGTLLRSRRQQLHARIAKVLDERFPDRAQSEPELLAHHYAEAGLVEKAIGYWHQAGQRAIARSAMAEAVAHLTRALDLLATMPNTPERRQEELGLQTTLGGALIAAKGLAAPEVASAYARAHELCLQVGDSPLLFSALCGQYWYRSQRGELDQTLAVAEEVLRLAERQGDAAPLVIGHRIVGTCLFHLGRLASARAHLERALALYDPARHHSLASIYIFDPRVAGLSFLSWLLFALGYPEQALRRTREAIDDARRLAHPHTEVHALANACVLHQLCRNRPAVEEQADALISLAKEQGFQFWLAIGTIVRGWALADGGEAKEGIAQINQGLADYWATGAELWSPYFLALLTEAHARAEDTGAGLSLVADALGRVERTGGRWFEAELHRLQGELLLLLPNRDTAEAEACFRRAIVVAREQEARAWELRAATSVAGLWRDQGRRAEARDLLAPVYSRFDEGFDTPDLGETKALLDELS